MTRPHRLHLQLLLQGVKVVFPAVRCAAVRELDSDAEGATKYTRAVPRVRARLHVGSTKRY